MKRYGFTIVEFLMVIMVIAIASTLTIINMHQKLDSTVLRNEALNLQRKARFARLLAGQKHITCRLNIDLDEGAYWLSMHGGAKPVGEKKKTEVDEDDVLLREQQFFEKKLLPEKLRFSLVMIEDDQAITTGQAAIEFRIDGSAQAGLVRIGNDQDAHTLVIYPCTARSELHDGTLEELPTETIDLTATASSKTIFVK